MTGGLAIRRRAAAVGVAAGCLLASLLAGSAAGAPGDFTATLAADVNPGTNGSDPGELVRIGNDIYFAAEDNTNGRELWKFDGTTATLIDDDAVADGGINPGPSSSEPEELTVMDGVLYFDADDGTNGRELWRTDGTPAGTYMVVGGEGITTGGGADPNELRNAGGTLFFAADDGFNGYEVWMSNGTEDGTTMLDDNDPDDVGIRDGTAGSNPGRFTALNGLVFFQANDGSGADLWQTDGMPAGTMMVEAGALGSGIYDGGDDANIGRIVNANGVLFFPANVGNPNSHELWKTTGTTASVVADINPGTGSSNPNNLVVVGSTVFFAAYSPASGDEVWRSDGTTTTLVDNTSPADGGINPGTDGSNPSRLTNVNGTVLFRANDGSNGSELWRTDGTAAGTFMVEDAIPGGGINPNDGSVPDDLVAIGSRLFFSADDGSNGRELWVSDGTPSGTRMAQTATPGGINPDGGSSTPYGFTELGGAIFFAADDGAQGTELWKATIEGPGPVVTPPVVTPPVTTPPSPPAKKRCKKKKGKKGAAAAKKKCKKRKGKK